MTSELPYRMATDSMSMRLPAGFRCGSEESESKSEFGFIAHSDGDVAIHALCDAILLGALALGDIGHLFPDNDDRWKGVDSKELLKTVTDLAKERGWAVGNADITIALQRPCSRPLHRGDAARPRRGQGHSRRQGLRLG